MTVAEKQKTTNSSKVRIGNIFIDNITMAGTLEKIEGFIQKDRPISIVTPNADHIVRLQKDKEFLDIYKRAALILADGMPLVWASRFLHKPLVSRVTGSDLFIEICRIASKQEYRLFFLGGREGAAEKAAEVMKSKFGDVPIVGTYCPPYNFESDNNERQRIVDLVRASKADILFVGLGSPKQERWIDSNLQNLDVPVSIGVGVSFEFAAGMVKRAPVWMQSIGFEWFWRLVMEPKRLWKRYLIDDMRFFGIVYRQWREEKHSRHKKQFSSTSQKTNEIS